MRFRIKQIRRQLLVVAAVGLLGWIGCEFGSSPDHDEQPDDPTAQPGDQTDDDVESGEDIQKVWGVLPKPPDGTTVQNSEGRMKVRTSMELDELEELFLSHAVDYEVLRPSGGLRVEPLRSNAPSARVYRSAGRNSPLLVDYQLDLGPDEQVSLNLPGQAEDQAPEDEEDADTAERSGADDSGPQPFSSRHSEWLDEVRGEPVEIRDSNGELIAPGARWGEPYTPPEGSPLHSPEFRHNFGRPFGDWQPM